MPKKLSEEFEMFDFTPAEEVVFSVLKEKKALSISELARQAKTPRTTVTDVLERLKERKLVRRVSKGYSSKWRLLKPIYLEKHLNNVADALEIPLDKDFANGAVMQGWSEILEYNTKLLASRANKRMFLLQTTSSLQGTLANITDSALSQFNQLAKKQGLIIELVLTQGAFKLYCDTAREHPDWAKNVFGRMMDVRILGDNNLEEVHSDLMIYKDHITFTNWATETMNVVQNQEAATLATYLFKNLQNSARKIDLNAEISN